MQYPTTCTRCGRPFNRHCYIAGLYRKDLTTNEGSREKGVIPNPICYTCSKYLRKCLREWVNNRKNTL